MSVYVPFDRHPHILWFSYTGRRHTLSRRVLGKTTFDHFDFTLKYPGIEYCNKSSETHQAYL